MFVERQSEPMLVIRKEQMEVLGRYMLKQFEDRMVIHLRSGFREQTKDMPETDLRSMIQTAIDKGKVYNVTTEDDVQRYLEYMMIYGPEFDTDPKTMWAGEILRTEDMDGTEKMELMDEHFDLEEEGLA